MNILSSKNICYLLTAPPSPDTSLQVTMAMGGKSEITLLGVMGFQRLMFLMDSLNVVEHIVFTLINVMVLKDIHGLIYIRHQDVLWRSINVHTHKEKNRLRCWMRLPCIVPLS